MNNFRKNTLRFNIIPILLSIASLAIFAAIIGITVLIIKKTKDKNKITKTEEERQTELNNKSPIYPPIEDAQEDNKQINQIAQLDNNNQNQQFNNQNQAKLPQTYEQNDNNENNQFLSNKECIKQNINNLEEQYNKTKQDINNNQPEKNLTVNSKQNIIQI